MALMDLLHASDGFTNNMLQVYIYIYILMFFRCKLWLQACGREDLSASEYEHYHKTRRVCNKHLK